MYLAPFPVLGCLRWPLLPIHRQPSQPVEKLLVDDVLDGNQQALVRVDLVGEDPVASVSLCYVPSLHHPLSTPLVRRFPRHYGRIRLLRGVDGGVTVALSRPARLTAAGHR